MIRFSKITIPSIFLLIIFAVLIDQYGQQIPPHKGFDAIIVAGCRVQSNGQPSLALQYRTDHAVQLLQEGYAERIIFTGGSPDNRKTEAKSAQLYALEKYQLSEAKLLLEEESTSTEENAQLASEMYPTIENIIMVSDSYHLFRAVHVFDNYFSEVYPSGRVPRYNVRIPGALRELVAIPYYFMQGKL